MSASRFEFYEKVRVIATDPAKAQILGQLGAILGKSQNDHGVWSYAVSIYRDGICWSCNESELESTGDFDRRETFHDGTSTRIRVDEHGQGFSRDDTV